MTCSSTWHSTFRIGLRAIQQGTAPVKPCRRKQAAVLIEGERSNGAGRALHAGLHHPLPHIQGLDSALPIGSPNTGACMLGPSGRVSRSGCDLVLQGQAAASWNVCMMLMPVLAAQGLQACADVPQPLVSCEQIVHHWSCRPQQLHHLLCVTTCGH